VLFACTAVHLIIEPDQSHSGEGEIRLLSVPGKTPDKDKTKMKTICALTIVASVMYILLMLLRFT